MNLFRAINEHDVNQSVYVPVRTAEELNKHVDPELTRIVYKFSHILRPYHKALFHLKIRQSLADLTSWKDPRQYDIVHAHFLFSDGAKALKLKQRYGLPYIVSVRNTDVNSFFKYMVHLRKLGVEIILNAEQVIFLNPKYKELTFKRYIPEKHVARLEEKCVVIPNGLDDFWIENRNEAQRTLNKPVKLLYVGDYTPNKNIAGLIQAAELLQKSGTEVELHLVGGGGEKAEQTSETIANSSLLSIKEHGIIKDRAKLLARYKEADIFVMPSFRETFGLVYLEALSQGLPVIYSQNQGIDGYFPEGHIGYSVDPRDPETIKEAVSDIIPKHSVLSSNAIKECVTFEWSRVAKTYVDIFKRVYDSHN